MKELTLRELQLECLDVLKDVHRFCVDNSIKYSLLDGSMLGAVRHQGFIPWDDDVDIIMPRPDYERFCKIYQSDTCRLKYRGNDKNCMIAFARVYDTKKTVMRTTMPWCKDEVGVWIDVFPADAALDDLNEHQSFYAKNRKFWAHTCTLRNSGNLLHSKMSLAVRAKMIMLHMMYKLGFTDYYVKRMIERAKSIEFGSTGYWTQIMCMGDNSKEHNRMETFAECSLMPFEDTQVFVMNGYDEVLKGKYKDYMKLPPENERTGHGSSYIHFYWK